MAEVGSQLSAHRLRALSVAVVLVLAIITESPATPLRTESRLHSAGEVWVNITNAGNFGSGRMNINGRIRYDTPRPTADLERLNVQWQPSFEFPGGGGLNYLHIGGLVFGCIRGPDTLVTTPATGWAILGTGFPEWSSHTSIVESSSRIRSPHYDPEARAEQQYFGIFADTTVWPTRYAHDEIERRSHKPIGVEVHQTSYASSDAFSRRFVIVDSWILNITSEPIRKSCLGVVVITGIHSECYGGGSLGILTGLLQDIPGIAEGTRDSVAVAWTASNTGLIYGSDHIDEHSPTGVFGLRVLRGPPGAQMSFNWWAGEQSDSHGWGPRNQKDASGYAGSLGRPIGDRGWYRMMTNGEIDYDQVFAATDRSADGWSKPSSDGNFARDIAAGAWTQFIISFGPLPDIAPGDSIPLTFALVAGAGLHTDERNFLDNFNPADPTEYLSNLDFSDLSNNARWADWVFDNPGIDTDGDGDRGRYHLRACNPYGTGCDTAWYKGDGIPDFKTPESTPPMPEFQLTTAPHTAILRWTGALSETHKDAISGQRDFEGYRVYVADADVADVYSLVASWDLTNFSRSSYYTGSRSWLRVSYPLTVDGWKREFGDPELDVRDYSTPSLSSAYADTVVDTIRDSQGQIIRVVSEERHSYWVPEGPNQSNAYWQGREWEENLIRRVGERDTIIGDDTLTYGIYEATLEHLSATVPLYFALTVFDHGDYRRGVVSQETSPHGNNKYGFILYSADVVSDSGLKVAVYPNPYKGRFQDAYGNWTNYYAQGFEARGHPIYTPFDRRIWFANLPDTATIRIYSVDGDLIREIHHPDPFLTRYSSIVGWDLISRNQQEVESGIYIYRVDSHLGSQMGKFVIIK